VTIQPVSQPMSPLRRRMLEDMATRGLQQDTQRDYIRFVRSFAEFLRRPPDTATSEDIRRFQVHQAESGVQPQSINCSVSALRFFFTVTLDRPDLSRRFFLVRYPRKLPTVLSASAMPLLRRSYGHHRDLSAYGSSAGATIVASLLPDHCTVTRRDEPQPAVEPMRLRPVEGLVPASITRSTTTTSTAGSPWLPPSQHLHHALTQRNYHQVPRVSPIPQSTRHSFIRSRILKSP